MSLNLNVPHRMTDKGAPVSIVNRLYSRHHTSELDLYGLTAQANVEALESAPGLFGFTGTMLRKAAFKRSTAKTSLSKKTESGELVMEEARLFATARAAKKMSFRTINSRTLMARTSGVSPGESDEAMGNELDTAMEFVQNKMGAIVLSGDRTTWPPSQTWKAMSPFHLIHSASGGHGWTPTAT
eukprot:311839-Amphidinium_carterae.1